MIGQLQRTSVLGTGRRLAEEYAGRKELNRLNRERLEAGDPRQNPLGTTGCGELAYLDLNRWASDGAAAANAAVVGVPGAGKSTALYRAMTACANQGLPGVFVALGGEAPGGMPKVRLSDLSSIPLLSVLPEGYERLTEKLVTEFLLEALDVKERWPHGALIGAAVRESVSGRAPLERSARSLLDFFHRHGRDVDASTAHQQAACECRDRLRYVMELPETEQLFRDVEGDLWLSGGCDQVSAVEFDSLQYPMEALREDGPGGFAVRKGAIGSFPVSEGERVCLAALPVLVAHCYSLALGKRNPHATVAADSGSASRPQAVLALDDADLLMRARRGRALGEAILAEGRKQGVSVWMSARRWRSLEPLSPYLPTRLIGALREVYPSVADGESALALLDAGVRPHTPVLKKLDGLSAGEFIYSVRRPGYGSKCGIVRFFPSIESRPADGGDHSGRSEGALTGASDATQ